MSTNMNRVTVPIPSDVKSEVEKLKRTQFFDKPYSELYRQALRCGIGVLKSKQQKETTDGTEKCKQ